MKMPRRVRRCLLLPPGWVALGFLLLLGCQALQPWAGPLTRWNVMQLTMPPLHTTELAPWNEVIYKSADQLNDFRLWHTAELIGSDLPDFLNTATIEAAVKKIIADTAHAGGVRIRFRPGATYSNLVKVLDIMDYTNQKKYWLDIRHYPTTLYAITDQPTYTKLPLVFSCGTSYLEVYPPLRKTDFQEILSDFWKKLLTLVSRPWQATMVWLAIIGTLSLGRLFQPKLGRSNSWFVTRNPHFCLLCRPPYAVPFLTCRKRKRTSY